MRARFMSMAYRALANWCCSLFCAIAVVEHNAMLCALPADGDFHQLSLFPVPAYLALSPSLSSSSMPTQIPMPTRPDKRPGCLGPLVLARPQRHDRVQVWSDPGILEKGFADDTTRQAW